jgi:hypothetical protein
LRHLATISFPDGDIRATWRADTAGKRAEARNLKGQSVRKTLNKTMIIAGTSALALIAGIAVAQSVGNDGADVSRAQLATQLDARFARLDANGDGSIDANERASRGEDRRAEHFKRLDANSDGSITEAEMNAAHEKRGEARAERRGRRGGMDGGHRRGGRGFGGRGGNADANGDGLVSRAEFQARALARFDRGDADRNGILTAAERRQAREAARAERGKR